MKIDQALLELWPSKDFALKWFTTAIRERFRHPLYYILLHLFYRFIIKDRETFFSSAQRSQMVWQILMRTSYDDDDSDKVGIVRLLSNGVFKAAYPLHDGRAMKDDNKSHLCSRRVSIC